LRTMQQMEGHERGREVSFRDRGYTTTGSFAIGKRYATCGYSPTTMPCQREIHLLGWNPESIVVPAASYRENSGGPKVPAVFVCDSIA
jgi:hypothetical protein